MGKRPPKPTSSKMSADTKSIIGRRVLKDFLDDNKGVLCPFGGTIVSYYSPGRYFRVNYDDGDAEDLFLEELEPLMERAKREEARQTAQPQSKHRLQSRKAPKAQPTPPQKTSQKTTKFPTATPTATKTTTTSTPRSLKKENRKRKAESANGTSSLGKRARRQTVSCSSDDDDDERNDGDTIVNGGEEIAFVKSKMSANAAAATVKRALAASAPQAQAKDDARMPEKNPHRATKVPKAAAIAASPPCNATATKTKTKKNKAKPQKGAPLSDEHRATIALKVPEIDAGVRYVYPPGQEPWRDVASMLAMKVREYPNLDAASVKAVRDCKAHYYRLYRKAQQHERERVAKLGRVVDGKRLSERPDRVTESWMKSDQGFAMHQEKCIGHVPGIVINQRFYGRAELSCVGMHKPPVAGIDYLGTDKTGVGLPCAVSIVCSGWYEDDGDAGEELVFTGEGGNDLLGNRKQVSHQQLVRGNAALVGNIRLGLPVRVVRKNKDPAGIYGCVLIYDGLYDVVEYWKEKGKQGFEVFRFRLVRRPGQSSLLSRLVTFGGMSAPKQLTPLARPGIVDVDISGGKEPLGIPAVNETEDGKLPPCSCLDRVPEEAALKGVHRGITGEQLEALRRGKWTPEVEYVTEYVYSQGVALPVPPKLPLEFASDPHAYVAKLNRGRLPYQDSRNGKLVQLREALPVVYECGPWAGCALGKDCPQAATQRPPKYRLEVFRTTDNRGWGLRSLDMIPQFAHVAGYFGDVYSADAFDHMIEQGHDPAYSMDLVARPDRDWEGNELEGSRSTAHAAKFVVCGLKRRSVTAFINHSCAPNCFVQPVLSEHHEITMPRISIFAAEDIAPFTELTLDYGEDYWGEGQCLCGAQECVSKKTRNKDGESDRLLQAMASPTSSPLKRRLLTGHCVH